MNSKNSVIFSFLKVFIITDLCLLAYSVIFQDLTWLLNTQVAFGGSLLVTLASFLSYRRNVNNRLSNYETKDTQTLVDDRDKVDEIDDPFDLYSEDPEPISEEELTPEKIKEIIKEEKSKVKKNSLKNTIFSAGGFVSIYRIFGYGFLIFGFFALNNNKIFDAVPFLIGLGVVPIATLISKFLTTSKSKEDQ